MNKNYDLAVGAKRLEKVTPSLIRTILDPCFRSPFRGKAGNSVQCR